MTPRADAVRAALDAAFHADTAVARDGENEVRVCLGGTCGALEGLAVRDAFVDELARRGIQYDWRVVGVGCHGLCGQGPVVLVEPLGILYPRVETDLVPEIVETTLVGGDPVQRLLSEDPRSGQRVARRDELPFFAGQQRLVLALAGGVDPESIDDYLSRGGYGALAEALADDDPYALVDLLGKAGLRERGGGGDLVSEKWRRLRSAPGSGKYVVCSAVDPEAGVPVDRSIVASVPHAVIEGIMIAGFTTGATHGVVYLPHHDRHTVERVRGAITACRERGLLGENVLDAGWSFDLDVVDGDAAAICRDETALIASLEGRRAVPQPATAAPEEAGLWGRPTVVHDAQALATVPWIVANGAAAFEQAGRGTSHGTKVLSLSGRVHDTGLVEVPLGTSLREIVDGIGGGVSPGRELKAVQLGGASGCCLPASFLDVHLDAAELRAVGTDLDAGAIVVADDTTCMVELARSLLAFSRQESCGRCVPCRLGTQRMLEILDRIVAGEGRDGDLELLEELGEQCAAGTQCELGAAAPDPVLSTLRFFREEYEAHVVRKCCPAGSCAALITFSVDAEACTGCTECVGACPVGAITGERDRPHVIDLAHCMKCGTCHDVCRFGAVVVHSGLAPAIATSET